jgi:hypothetical protein
MLKHRTSLELAFAALGFALVTSAAGAQQQPRPTQRQAGGAHRSAAEEPSQGASFTFKIAPNLPEFTFKVIPEPREADQWGNAQTTVRDVEVFRGDSTQLLQHLTGCEWSDMEPPPAGYDWFRADDINFDGYQDIYVMTHWGATGNQYGCIWLYNPAIGGFDFSKEFSELSRYQLDPGSKTILTFDNGGQAGMVHSAEKYKVEDNRPVLIWSERQDWDFEKKQFHCIVKERRGSEMVTVHDEWGNSEDGMGPCVPGRLFQHPAADKSPAR